MMQLHIRHSLLKSALIIMMVMLTTVFVGGCGLSPEYTVRVENESASRIQARIERRPNMNNMIELDGDFVDADSELTLGPVNAPPLERVYIVITSTRDMHALPESHKLLPGSYTVRVSDGSVSTWSAYEISVSRD